MLKKQCIKSITILFCSLLFLFTIKSQAYSLVYDFDSGTNEGWTVIFNTGSGETAATWYDGVNYSGDQRTGRPPVTGPFDPLEDNKGALQGIGSGDSISSFASPIFTPQAMDSISAYFIIADLETGIPDSIDVYGRIGYTIDGDSSFYFGSYFPLLGDSIAGTASYLPLWTLATVNVTSGHLVNQLFVNITVDGTPLVSGTQNYVDYVTTSYSGNGNGQVVPEPGTMVLVAAGLLGLLGVARTKRQ